MLSMFRLSYLPTKHTKYLLKILWKKSQNLQTEQHMHFMYRKCQACANPQKKACDCFMLILLILVCLNMCLWEQVYRHAILFPILSKLKISLSAYFIIAAWTFYWTALINSHVFVGSLHKIWKQRLLVQTMMAIVDYTVVKTG